MSIVEILSGPAGGLAYHLTTLFTAQAVFGMALGEWLRDRQPEHRRLSFAFGFLCLTRLFLIAVTLVTWQGFVPPQSVLPPLELFLDLVTLLVIVYALDPREDRTARVNRRFCIINLGLAFGAYCVFAPVWYTGLSRYPSLHYNGSWQEWIWVAWQVIVVVWAVSVMVRHGVRQRGLFTSIFSILLIGEVMQLVVPQAAPDVAVWGRLAGLIAYPVFVVAIYRSVVNDLAWRTTGPAQEAVPEEAIYPKDVRDVSVFEAALNIFSSLDMSTVLERATSSAMEMLEVDLVAVLTRKSESSQTLEIAAARHSVGLYETDRGQVDVRTLPPLQRALESQQGVVLEAQSDETAEWQDLLEQMGAAPGLSLVLEPLVAGESSIGVLAIGDSSQQRLSYARNSQLSHILAKSIASAVGNAMLHHDTATQSDDHGEGSPELVGMDTGEVVEADLGCGTPPNTYPPEPLQVDLLNAQRELDEARQEVHARRTVSEEDGRERHHEERSQIGPEPEQAWGDLLDQGGRLDIELVERLEAELKQAHLDLAQARAALQERSPAPDSKLVDHAQTDGDHERRDSSESSGDAEERNDRLDVNS